VLFRMLIMGHNPPRGPKIGEYLRLLMQPEPMA
jgi:hypothetical protein